MVKYLQTNYPKETANVTPKDSANIGQAAGSSTAKTEDDGEEDDEEDEEDDDDYVDELPAMRKASTVRGRRTSVSAGVMSAASMSKKAPDVYFEKTDDEKKRLRGVLKANWLCSHLDEEQAVTVINAMEKVTFESGEDIIKQGDLVANHYFILDSGKAEVLKGDESILVYESGAGFGELALMYHAPRAATVRATEKSVVWQLNRDTFKFILFRTSTQKRSKYKEFLNSVEILQTLSEYERLTLADALVEETFTDVDIVTQGSPGEKFFIIEDGAVEVVKDGKSVGELKRGSYFGEIALMKNVPRQATIRAVGTVRVLYLTRGVFNRLFGKISTILERNMTVYLKYLS